MSHSLSVPSWVPGAIVSILGAGLATVQLLYGGIPAQRHSPVIVSSVAGPLLVSLFVIGFGLWIATREWPIVSPWRCTGWCTCGFVTGLILSLGLVWHQFAIGRGIADPLFVLATFATHGTAGGFLIGYYDIRVQESQVILQQQSQQLREFASIVSHDLRNPLQAAQGHLALLAEEYDSDHIAPIQRAHERMERIIEETFALVQPSHDDILSFELVGVRSIAHDAWQEVMTADWDYDPVHADSDLQIATTQYVRAHGPWLRQLFANLFRNALEHNKEPITITVGDLPAGDGFYVEDTGVGIPPELRDRVFESGFTTAESGTGVGLAIVRAIADAHGWATRITEGPNGGARIEIKETRSSVV